MMGSLWFSNMRKNRGDGLTCHASSTSRTYRWDDWPCYWTLDKGGFKVFDTLGCFLKDKAWIFDDFWMFLSMIKWFIKCIFDIWDVFFWTWVNSLASSLNSWPSHMQVLVDAIQCGHILSDRNPKSWFLPWMYRDTLSENPRKKSTRCVTRWWNIHSVFVIFHPENWGNNDSHFWRADFSIGVETINQKTPETYGCFQK